MKYRVRLLILALSISILFYAFSNNPTFVDYTVLKPNNNVILVWADSTNKPLNTFDNLASFIAKQGKELLFAMNGGMYMQNSFPVGLYIEKGKVISILNTKNAKGNFYLKPNGVFYITNNNTTNIIETSKFDKSKYKSVKYATQSGPMLLTNGAVHKAFTKGSKNLNIRNGVGVLANGGLVFSISAKPVNFYDFAMHFKSIGCKNALYLDGFVSKMYYPEKKLKGSKNDKFGVMVAVVK